MSDAPKLDFEQRQRAALIAESRGIDDDTAFELVYLQDLARNYAAASRLHSTEAVNLASDVVFLTNEAVEAFRQRAVAAVLEGEDGLGGDWEAKKVAELLQQLPATEQPKEPHHARD